jgi:DNA-binding GntR family transcriptional regulator
VDIESLDDDAPARSGLANPTLHQRLADLMRDMILRGVLAPESRIPEQQLCREFGVSRTPLREALRVLATEGLVELWPNRGAGVTPVTTQETAEIFELMVPLEGVAGRLAAQRIRAEQMAEIEELHTRMRAAFDNNERDRYFQLNQRIHRRIAAATGNDTFVQTYRRFSIKIQRARAIANVAEERWKASMQEHEDFMAALRDGDVELFSERLEIHGRKTADAVLAALETYETGIASQNKR